MMQCERCKQPVKGVKKGRKYFQETDPFLKSSTKAFLDKTHYQVLCAECLSDIQELVDKAEEIRASGKRASLEENVNYYTENGLFVFTELHHILKGYCCQNCCRHCAYGFNTLINPVN
jgi:hypothetical protein